MPDVRPLLNTMSPQNFKTMAEYRQSMAGLPGVLLVLAVIALFLSLFSLSQGLVLLGCLLLGGLVLAVLLLVVPRRRARRVLSLPVVGTREPPPPPIGPS